MAGTTIGTPFGLQQPAVGGGAADSGVGPLRDLQGQVHDQTSDFAGKLQDPNFTGGSEMGEMLKLQRAMSLETMMYTTVSNVEKARTDASKGAINNIK